MGLQPWQEKDSLMDYDTVMQILGSTVRLGTPLLLACLAGLFSERSGVFDIGLEGKMLAAAMAAATVAFMTGSAWIGLGAGIVASLLFSALHGLASISFKGNQLISGVALNFLASGLTVLIAQALFKQGGRTPALAGDARFNPIDLPFAEAVKDLPFLGPLYAQVISGHSILVYAAFAAVPLSWWLLNRTRFGLRLRAAGENPAALDTAGVSVVRMRYAALFITGVLCGLAGAYMATALQAGFGREMTAGRGYIALAALIFAKWRALPALGATMLFGFFQALALRPDVVETVTHVKISGSFLDALPYILTVIAVAGFIGKSIPPRAGGEPYVKER
jgi:general nucleoside transport system permease protein